MNGVLIIDKTPGITSHDVVNRVRRILQQRSVGHLGTLDPLATGVLPLVAGTMTRLAQFYTKSCKTYEGLIRFGFATDTYDSDGDPVGEAQQVQVTLQQLQELARRFQGAIEQMPPPFSAKKIHGVPAYKLVRRQKEVVLKPVRVEIMEFEIIGLDSRLPYSAAPAQSMAEEKGDRAFFRARVGSGTYMRSVAHDMGQQLGCGAHLSSLRRTRVAEFDISEAHTLESVQAAAENGRLQELFVHPRTLLPDMPSVTANEESAARIRSGRTVNLPEMSRARQIKVFYGQKELLAIATRVAGTLFHPGIVLDTNPQEMPVNGR